MIARCCPAGTTPRQPAPASLRRHRDPLCRGTPNRPSHAAPIWTNSDADRRRRRAGARPPEQPQPSPGRSRNRLGRPLPGPGRGRARPRSGRRYSGCRTTAAGTTALPWQRCHGGERGGRLITTAAPAATSPAAAVPAVCSGRISQSYVPVVTVSARGCCASTRRRPARRLNRGRKTGRAGTPRSPPAGSRFHRAARPGPVSAIRHAMPFPVPARTAALSPCSRRRPLARRRPHNRRWSPAAVRAFGCPECGRGRRPDRGRRGTTAASKPTAVFRERSRAGRGAPSRRPAGCRPRALPRTGPRIHPRRGSSQGGPTIRENPCGRSWGKLPPCAIRKNFRPLPALRSELWRGTRRHGSAGRAGGPRKPGRKSCTELREQAEASRPPTAEMSAGGFAQHYDGLGVLARALRLPRGRGRSAE